MLSAELSTIIEADNSGTSKRAKSPPVAKHTESKQEHNDQASSMPEPDVDASALDLSTTHLADQLRDAIREGDSLKEQWLNADKAVVIIDADEHPDVDNTDNAFIMDSVDRDLADLLSPHSTTKDVPLQTSSTPIKGSPTLPSKFPASPASRLPRARQASSLLPRFRLSNSPSRSPYTPSPTPKASSSIIGNGYSAQKSSSSSSLPSTSTPMASRRSITLNQYRPSVDSNTTTRASFDGISRPGSATLLRDRGSSTSGVLSPSPLGVGNPVSTLTRISSLRSASEYNPTYGRSHSRLTLSEAGTGLGMPRRGSESYCCASTSSYGRSELMESPTFTVSSGSRERDTPKSSVSTAPTSLADSFGYLGRDRSERDLNRERDRDREREREEMREMKEKHGTEMGALLGALSDSQRTVRMLREENSDLRDRLERLTVAVQANLELRQVCGDLQSECSNLRRENTDLRRELVGLRATNSLAHSWIGNSTGLRTPVPRVANRSPLTRNFTPRAVQQEEYDATFIDHGSQVENHLHYLSSKDSHKHGAGPSDITLPSSSTSTTHKRRLSNSSSIFPIPPSNMTLLLHEDATSTLGSIGSSDNRSSFEYGFSLPPASICANSSSSSSQRKTHVRSLSHSPTVSDRNFGGGGSGNLPNTSVTSSVGNMSPSTANFSMATGSPGSLFLRPEHEILLGDMESLDLGIQAGDGEVAIGRVDSW